MRSFTRPGLLMTLAAAAVVTTLAASDLAFAELRSDGPLLAVGFTEKLRADLVIPTLGWRWQLGAGQTLERWGAGVNTDVSFVLEPSVGAIVGDEESIEAQALPLLHLEPATPFRLNPYFEAGVGVIYTAIEDLRLGSNFLFSDDLGLGLSFANDAWRWKRLSVGYRFRHISHAGIFGEPNSGMNTHYLTLTVQ